MKPDVLLEQIRNDYYQAVTSWLFFMQGNGPFDGSRSTLIEAVDTQRLGLAYNFVQNIAVANCIISICRLTDRHSPDRVNLAALQAILRKDRELFVEMAKEQFAKEDAGIRDQMAAKAALDADQTIDALIGKIAILLDSTSLKEIRKHRDAVIAHSLNKTPDPPKISAVEEVLKSLRPILVDAYLVLRRTSLVIEIAEEDYDSIFSKFWSAVEYGAVELEKQKQAKIDEIRKKYLPDNEPPGEG